MKCHVAMLGLMGATLAASAALAQKVVEAPAAALDEITVSASRLNAKPQVSTAGWPRSAVKQVTLSYDVSLAGVDLDSHSAVAGMEKVISDTALDICKELGRQYPNSTPDDAACAKAATAKATKQLHDLVTAAAKKAAK